MMIVDLTETSREYPMYFINVRGSLFYKNYENRDGGYYIRLDSSTDWKCIHLDGADTNLPPENFVDKPHKIWKQVSLKHVRELVRRGTPGPATKEDIKDIQRQLAMTANIPDLTIRIEHWYGGPVRVINIGSSEKPATMEDIATVQRELSKISVMPGV